MVTIREIADYCGVSTATVSKALNQGSDISAETSQRIRAAAHQMGYFPNAAARALKTKHSHNLGLLTQLRDKNGLSHDFVALVINAFQAEAERSGYDVTFVSENIFGTTLSYVEHCRYRNFDGVALICADFYSDAVRELLDSGIPCVTVDCFGTKHGSVMTNNEEALYSLVHYVYERGHRKIAYVSGKSSAIADIRLSCFRKACHDHGLDLPEGYIDSAYYNDFITTAEATRRLLRLPQPPTCIFYQDDFACIGGVSELQANGLSVPEDMSIVGFDGIQLSQVMQPRLTTYRQDMDAIGKNAVLMLREAIENPKIYLPRQRYITGELVPGETVAELSAFPAATAR
ncbi:MAG TPA: LacI family DNA-binding transcriptional regulator [Candidatus Limiplasma sp.]|nr:LacI family DNA-binding transcriptional regulator [Candidatus Limiplasma sp.]